MGAFIRIFGLVLALLMGHHKIQDFPATEFNREALQEDFSVLKDAILTLHSGLYRYADSAMINEYFDILESEFQNKNTIDAAYLSISKFTAQIKCGHTYANYYNQKKALQEKLFLNDNKLPFTFKIVDDQLVLLKNLSDETWLDNPTVITSINDISTKSVITSLLPYIHTDGSNLAQKYTNLAVSGQGEFEAFDIFFPMLFGTENNKYKISAQNLETKEEKRLEILGISRTERKERIQKKYGEEIPSYDDLWQFDIVQPDLAALKLGTFVTYKMNLNWKEFIKDAFEEIERKAISNVVIDLRGNGGGMSEVGDYLMKYLLQNEYHTKEWKQYIRSPKTPDRLRPYLSTWENSFYDMSKKVVLADNGMYESKRKNKTTLLRPGKKRYTGKIFLLIDAANSSATFHLAKKMKESQSATLVGQETGGNMMGTTAGAILFLTLPNTKIEVDIPLIADVFPGQDEGLKPDIFVPFNPLEMAKGVDTEMEAIKSLISKK